MRSNNYFNTIPFLTFMEIPYFCSPKPDVAKLADAPDLGSGGVIHVGSTPIIRTFFIS